MTVRAESALSEAEEKHKSRVFTQSVARNNNEAVRCLSFRAQREIFSTEGRNPAIKAEIGSGSEFEVPGSKFRDSKLNFKVSKVNLNLSLLFVRRPLWSDGDLDGATSL